MNSKHFSWLPVLIAGIISLVSAQSNTITVLGTVTDGSDNAIADARVIISTGMGGGSGGISDTMFTSANGKFIDTITIPSSAFGILYTISKTGYTTATGLGRLDNNSDTIDLDTIQLTGATIDTVTVTGRVLDSISRNGITNALVLIAQGNLVDLATLVFDSVHTDTAGRFSLKILASSGGGMGQVQNVVYRVIKTGYTTKSGTSRIRQQSVTINNILLAPSGVGIAPVQSMTPVTQKANRTIIYSLNGRMLYAGKETDLNAPAIKGLLAEQPYVAHFFADKKLLYSKKCPLK